MIKQGKNAALEIRRRENFVRAFDEDVTLWRNLMRLLLITALVVAAAGPALAQSDFPDPPLPQMSGDQAGPRMGMMRPPERETLAEQRWDRAGHRRAVRAGRPNAPGEPPLAPGRRMPRPSGWPGLLPPGQGRCAHGALLCRRAAR